MLDAVRSSSCTFFARRANRRSTSTMLRVGKRADQRERNRTMHAALQSSHRLAPVLERRERGLGMWQEGTAGLGQPCVAADAFEHRRTEFVLENAEAAADRGLRAVQPPAGAGEAAEFGDGDEGFDLVDVHRSGILMLMQNTMHLTMHGSQRRYGMHRTRRTHMRSQTEKAIAFRALHERPGAFIIPNPWDAGTAKLLAALGFEALATTSLGLANMLGRDDSVVTRAEVIENCRAIAAATDLPVNADLENCFAHAPEAAADDDHGSRPRRGRSVARSRTTPAIARTRSIDFDLAVARVRAAAEVAHALPVPFLLTARAENLLHGPHDLAEAIRRLQAYEAAGADVLYAPGLRNLDEVRQVVSAVKRPFNVVTGWLDPDITAAQLAEAGAKRISVGGALSRLALATFVSAGRAMQEDGSFAWMRDMMPTGEARRMFGEATAQRT